MLHTNGLSSTDISNIGLLLIGPTDEEVGYTFHFNFQTLNNNSKYEGLIALLRLAFNLGAKQLVTFRNSMIMLNQVKGTFKIQELFFQIYADGKKTCSIIQQVLD